MTYETQLAHHSLANLYDDDGDDDATIIFESPRFKAFARDDRDDSMTVIDEAPEVVIELFRRATPAVVNAGRELPAHWNKHFWASPPAEPIITWKDAGSTTQRIVRAQDPKSWRSSHSNWKPRLAVTAMLCFLASAIAAIALMAQA